MVRQRRELRRRELRLADLDVRCHAAAHDVHAPIMAALTFGRSGARREWVNALAFFSVRDSRAIAM